MGVRGFETQWVGWPGVHAQGNERAALSATLAARGHTGVYLDGALMDLHYNGFCNSVLWPLFHYVPLAIDSKLSDTRAFGAQWNAYQLANRAFADAVLEEYTPGAMVWVQDYHLMLLPSLLKERVPGMKVGFFLHTPFPSSEIYRTLPVREELLRALLRSDLIGFHTYDYARHFVSACTRLLGLDATPSGVEDNGCLTRVAAFPIGIDPDRFTSALGSAEVRANVAQLLNRYAGRKVMLGVDRLDMVKGIPPKLLAFEKFLEEHPEWRDRVLLVQIAVPSRTDVPDYQRLRSVVHEVVGRINGAYGTLTHVPIYHLDRQLSFPELVALYAVTDVALVTSLRDGMNLVSYEYVACQRDNAGVLVLSEFAGAAQSLGAGALLVNPWNVSDVARAIHVALEMDEAQRRMRHQQNYLHVAQHTAQTWAELFISELDDTHVEAVLRTRAVPPPLPAARAVQAFSAARRRLLVLGYNATLTQAVPHISLGGAPKDHYDERRALTRVHPQALGALRALASDPSVLVLLVSGCTQALLEAAVGEARDAPRLWVAAENGVSVRDPGSGEWVPALELGDSAWMSAVQLVFEYFCERTPRSFVESRETSIVWNWKYADPEFGRLQARDLLQHLLAGPISNAYVDIVRGSKSIEVRPVGISKGLCVEKILHYIAETEPLDDVDFVFAAGHFYARDESVFTMLLGAGNAPPISPRQALAAWAPQ
ncbi:glycosyltransferase, partial [Helicosporidium sp. ATCC 50920]